MIKNPQPLPTPTVAWFDPKTGRPTQVYYEYKRSFDAAVRALITAQNGA